MERLGSKSLIERFDPASEMPAEMWIDCFDQITEHITGTERITLLLSYVAGDAFRWYAQFVTPNRFLFDWPTVRRMFVEKFGTLTVSPGVAAANRQLQPQESVQSYFDEKTRLMEMARFPERTMLEFLTDGVPDSMRNVLCAREPHTLTEWIRCASNYERAQNTETRLAADAPDV